MAARLTVTYVSAMLTDHPSIVVARPPRRIRCKPKASPGPKPPTIVGFPPDQSTPEELEQAERNAQAADRLWKELVRQATKSQP
jgi:hypothetical protein